MSRKLGFDLTEFRNIPLPSEREIMASWKGDPEQPVVSVLCNTYNHEIYIEDAIRGFLIQKTDFPFEVIIHDDASSDGNREIIERYVDKYPNIMRPVFQEINQYSQGKKPSILSFQFAKGDYIALCEGDDFWVHSDKLSKQVETIEGQGDISLLLSPGFRLSGLQILDGIFNVRGGSAKNITVQEILDVPGQFAPTASYFMKREVLATLPDWFEKAPYGDLFIELWAFTVGNVHYLPFPASVYRVNAVGSWSRNQKIDPIDKIDNMARRAEECFVELKRLEIFKNADISVKRASWEFGKALAYLEQKNYSSFKLAVTKSVGIKKFYSKGQRFSHCFRVIPSFVRFVFLRFRSS